ncbi:TPA: hypothetical protein ROB10_001519 [Escherichia coli]|nr:hypothetical protein [Escherichia coli]
MFPKVKCNNFFGAVELFLKSSCTKTHSNVFFNKIQHAFNKKDWISNYDSLLTLREFFRSATQIDKNSYQVLSSRNESVNDMDKFIISFSLKDNAAEYTMTLRGNGFEYEEIPVTMNEYNLFIDFKNREFPLAQNARLYAYDILQKKQSYIRERINGYIRQAVGELSVGYMSFLDVLSNLKRGKCQLQGGTIKEHEGWYFIEKIYNENFAVVIESLGFALKIYGGVENLPRSSYVFLEGEDYSLVYNYLVNANYPEVEIYDQAYAIMCGNLAANSDATKEEIRERYKTTFEALYNEVNALGKVRTSS